MVFSYNMHIVMTDKLVIEDAAANAPVSKRVFDGALLRFGKLQTMQKLVRAARDAACLAFAPAYPPHAHRTFDANEFRKRAAQAQQLFNNDKSAFADVLREVGLPLADMYWDTLGLRINPPLKTHGGGFRSTVNAHRDTWGAGLQAQINWWAPVWQLAKKRTMGFYPSYWTRPLENTTGQWKFADYIAARKQCASGGVCPYPSAPQPLQQPDEKPVPVIINVGDLLVFSSAHLHSSIANQTSMTRFSIEIRTLQLDDLRAKRGAPNVDNLSHPPLLRLFRGVIDNKPPPDDLS